MTHRDPRVPSSPPAYLDTPERWDAAIAACRSAGVFGLDTETTGHDVKISSPAHRALVHVWSIALRSGTRSPRGFRLARGAVLPAVALRYPAWVELLGDPGVVKVAHNAGHDAHALANAGVVLRGWRDTLGLARLVLPERAAGATGPDGEVWLKPPGYDLKHLAIDVLGKVPRETYRELVATTRVGQVVSHAPCPEPTCAKPATCLRRTGGHGRVRTTEDVLRPGPDIALEEITPGHERWDRLLAYAAADAVDALELAEWLDARSSRPPPTPWDGSDTGPGVGGLPS